MPLLEVRRRVNKTEIKQFIHSIDVKEYVDLGSPLNGDLSYLLRVPGSFGVKPHWFWFMRAPLEFLNLKHQRRLFLVCLILSVLMLFMLQQLDRPLRTAATPWGMVSFQLACSMEESWSILQSWGAMGSVHAALSLGLDFLFLLFYSSAYSLAWMLWGQGGVGEFWKDPLFWKPVCLDQSVGGSLRWTGKPGVDPVAVRQRAFSLDWDGPLEHADQFWTVVYRDDMAQLSLDTSSPRKTLTVQILLGYPGLWCLLQSCTLCAIHMR